MKEADSFVGRLYDAHGASLYRYAVMLLADATAAEDVIQQVLTTVLRQRPTMENEAHYLRRAVRNECYSALRRRHVRGETSLSAALLEPVAPGVPPESRLAIERALRELPPEQREVVHLHAFEGLTFQEIADAAETSINTVTARYRYALAKMRELLTDGQR